MWPGVAHASYAHYPCASFGSRAPHRAHLDPVLNQWTSDKRTPRWRWSTLCPCPVNPLCFQACMHGGWHGSLHARTILLGTCQEHRRGRLVFMRASRIPRIAPVAHRIPERQQVKVRDRFVYAGMHGRGCTKSQPPIPQTHRPVSRSVVWSCKRWDGSWVASIDDVLSLRHQETDISSAEYDNDIKERSAYYIGVCYKIDWTLNIVHVIKLFFSRQSISKSLPNFTWQFLCFANFWKDMQRKKSSSPTVWHNSLAKSRSNLHQESWEKQNYVGVLPPLENLYQESFYILYFVFTLHPQGNDNGNHNPRAHICAWRHEEVSFAKFLFLPSWFVKLLENNFLILPKLDGCQIDLTNCCSCFDGLVRFSTFSGFPSHWCYILAHPRTTFWFPRNPPDEEN
jgi:hypothetical protein